MWLDQPATGLHRLDSPAPDEQQKYAAIIDGIGPQPVVGMQQREAHDFFVEVGGSIKVFHIQCSFQHA